MKSRLKVLMILLSMPLYAEIDINFRHSINKSLPSKVNEVKTQDENKIVFSDWSFNYSVKKAKNLLDKYNLSERFIIPLDKNAVIYNYDFTVYAEDEDGATCKLYLGQRETMNGQLIFGSLINKKYRIECYGIDGNVIVQEWDS